MKTKFLLVSLCALLTASILSAQKATIIRLTGDQDVKLVTESGEEVPLARGAELNEGDFIVAGPNTKVFIKTFEGAITTLAEGGAMEIVKVQKQEDGTETTRVRLERGSVVANLDPSKRGTHDYGVETPRGVAAARGTNYSVTVNGVEVTVTVSGGVVSFSIPELAQPVVLNPGNVSTGGAATSLANALTSNPQTAAVVRQAMQATAAAVASLVNQPGSGVTAETLNQVVTTAAAASNEAGDGGSLVALVAATATQANPAVAEDVVRSAVSATSSSANASAVASNVVASVTRAVVSQQSGTSVTNTVNSLSQVANQASGGTVTVNPTTVENAVNESLNESAGDTTETPPPGGDTTSEPDVEVEVPNDNIIVSPSV